MRHFIAALWVIGIVPCAGTPPASAQDSFDRGTLDIDSIVARHIEARGGRARIAAIETLVYSEGRYREGDYVGSGGARMAFRRPYFRVVGDPGSNGFLEGYDGGTWEWFREPGIVIRTVGAASGAGRRGADFEGRLVDWRAKGSTLELGGSEVIGGRSAYRLTLTTRDGFRRDYFLDAETYLVVAERYVAPIHAVGEPVATEVLVEDHRPVSGVLFAHRYQEVEIATGRVLNEMEWGRIEAGVPLPLSHFSPPEFERTPLQRMLEAVYSARSDAEAVLWSYHEFRRGFPEIDAGPGIDFVARQMAKMGDVAAAVALLEARVSDAPISVAGTFTLAELLELAGDTGAALGAFRRVLELDPTHGRAQEAVNRLSG